MTFRAETLLPADIQQAACRRDNEWGWPPALIPQVIDGAEQSQLVSIGGQLQFLMPGGTCECYWVEVDTYKSVSTELPWHNRVTQTAAAARS